MKKFPKYVWYGKVGNCAMRLAGPLEGYATRRVVHGISESFYYRDAGEWGIDARMEDGKLITCNAPKGLDRLNGKELIPCTRAEWKKDNEGYV